MDDALRIKLEEIKKKYKQPITYATKFSDITFYDWLVGIAMQGLLAKNDISLDEIPSLSIVLADDIFTYIQKETKSHNNSMSQLAQEIRDKYEGPKTAK